jgi:general secretion pathway protein G
MLLVLVILSILGAIIYQNYSGQATRARKVAAQSQLQAFRSAFARYEMENDHFPDGRDGILSLVEKPREARNWHGPYIDGKIPKDPWGSDYLYERPGTHNRESYDLWSAGPDGVSGTEDDITNW